MSELARANWGEDVALATGCRDPGLMGPVLWLLIAIYAVARLLQIFPGKVPMAGVIALHVFPPLVFALIHGTFLYRVRGALTFIILFLLIGNFFESIGILTGFPFGHYYFTGLMGPKIFQVPVFLGFAYIGMAYLSWVLANVMLEKAGRLTSGSNVVLVPLLASLIMTSWDLSQDAIWSTYLHLWIWPRGGIYFGVPISNFFGWYLTVFVIYQSFAVYLRARNVPPRSTSHYAGTAIAFYAISAAGNLLPLFRAGNSVVADPTGTEWAVRDITFASALVSVFIMGAFALCASLRLRDSDRASRAI